MNDRVTVSQSNRSLAYANYADARTARCHVLLVEKATTVLYKVSLSPFGNTWPFRASTCSTAPPRS